MDSECICNMYAVSTHSMCFSYYSIFTTVFSGEQREILAGWTGWKWRDRSCLGPVSIAREPHGYRPMTTGSQDLGSIPRHCLFRTVGLRSQPSWQHTHSRSSSYSCSSSSLDLVDSWWRLNLAWVTMCFAAAGFGLCFRFRQLKGRQLAKFSTPLQELKLPLCLMSKSFTLTLSMVHSWIS